MGTKYLPNKAEELNSGRCTFHIESASFSDQGAWTCMFARETGLPDEKIIVDVSFKAKTIRNNLFIGICIIR